MSCVLERVPCAVLAWGQGTASASLGRGRGGSVFQGQQAMRTECPQTENPDPGKSGKGLELTIGIFFALKV